MTSTQLYERSRQPLFIQAAGQIRLKIEAGEWGAGYQLPALCSLQADFGLSRATIREALDVLEKEGLIVRQRGRGAFVRADLEARRTFALPTTWQALLDSLEGIEANLLSPVSHENGTELRNVLAGEATGDFVRLRRVHSHGADPYCLIDIHVRRDVFEENREAILAAPLILVLASRGGCALERALQRVTFSSADGVTAAALGVALGAPIVEILRTLIGRDGRVVAHTYARYPGQYVRLDFEFDPGQTAKHVVMEARA